ncbi:MAG: hypothetical protein J7527_01585 [Chitinophagaceae bacterium]|nr:hypothetical protein [Chitinophagaceae bacterium]
MKSSFRAAIGRTLSILTIASIITLSSCKKSDVENPATAESPDQVSTQALNIYKRCLPTQILMTPPNTSAWDYSETYTRDKFYNITYDFKSRPITADDETGNRHFTFTYDASDNLIRLRMYDDKFKLYLASWYFEYAPGSTQSFSPWVKTSYFSWNSVTGSAEFTSMRYYDNNKRLVRQLPIEQLGPNTKYYFFNYDAEGNLETITQGPTAATATLFYQFKPYDNNPSALSSHYVWQFLSGNYSKNNPGGTVRYPGEFVETNFNYTYQYGAYGYPLKATVNPQGTNTYLTKTMSVFPCSGVTPVPIPQPIPAPVPKPINVSF